jgi:ABC-type transporter Mla subunit MlaD
MANAKKISGSFLIGLFVIVSTFIIAFVVIWLGSTQFLQENILYVTYFDNSVEGLESGSPVKYQGVPVGTIKKISVAPDGKLVEVVMQIQKKLVISDSLRVKSEITGLAGGRFLQLYFPTKAEFANLSPKLTFVPPHKLISSAPSGMQEIEIAMRDVLDNLRMLKVKEISESTISFLQSSTDFFNNQELYSIITNLNEGSVRLAGILAHADTSKAIDNIEVTSQKLIQTADELKRFSENLNAELKQMNITKKLDGVFAEYDSVATISRRVINVIGFRTENALTSFNETLDQLKATNKQLRKSLKAISDNPSQVFFSEPPKKEK